MRAAAPCLLWPMGRWERAWRAHRFNACRLLWPRVPAELLGRLVRAAREGPSAVLAVLEPELRALGFSSRATVGAPHAVLWTRGVRPRLLLSGHVDVVPAGEGWTRDPFGGEVDEGRVWGRGSADMLGGVAAFVEAARRRPEVPCGILLTPDEETRMHAAVHAVQEGFLSGFEAAVVGEPTSLEVGHAEKGVLWLRVVTSGRNAHGSMPHLGENAAARLVQVVGSIESRAFPSATHALLGRATRNLGTLRSGEAVNQVPALGVAEYDVRYLPGTRAREVLARFEAAIVQSGEDARIEILSDHPPFEVPAEHALVQAARGAVARARGGAEPRLLGLPYGTEASKFAPAGLPCVILGPGEAALAHTNRESVPVEALGQAAEAYALLLDAYAQPGSGA